jgi:lysophospholipase
MHDGFVLVAGNPVPTNARCDYLEVSSKVKVRYGLFPAQGAARGTVCFLQGRGECMECNFETIRELSARGFQVATLDWRGQGGSPRAGSGNRHGHVGNFDRYVDDFTMLMRDVVLPDCPPPYLMLGNSMGGHIGLRVIARHNWFEAAVMVAPLIDMPRSRLPRWLQISIVNCMTWTGLGKLKVPLYPSRMPVPEGFEANPLTSDKIRYLRNMRLWQEAPGLAAFAPTTGWMKAVFQSCRKLQSLGDTTPLRCPALLVIAGQDSIVSNEAVQQFARYVPGAVTVSINGARHDILCERDTFRDQFFAAFEAFVADRVRGKSV